MKKTKKVIASFLAVLMLMAGMAPSAMALREIVVRQPGLNVDAVPDGNMRATFVSQPPLDPRRYVQAQVYAERANGSALWSVGSQQRGSSNSAFINILGMVVVQHSGWFA